MLGNKSEWGNETAQGSDSELCIVCLDLEIQLLTYGEINFVLYFYFYHIRKRKRIAQQAYLK